ncbi:TOTE conflict system archaeo-eukaryotic primase domain-containing protein [Paenibacillus sp. FSL E2-8871]|uniref:TOTE conflict system archaeo-eukaryotic primase domain-containing protein n=1 Tax=Paenibacillus sp. FSL E2-8871 TaxID=2975326 RepID=UPI004046D41C
MLDLFAHRRSAYAMKKENHPGQKGWEPVKDAGFNRPFGEGQVRTHLEGIQRLGIYPLEPHPQNTCIFVSADFDEHSEAFEHAWRLNKHLQAEGIYSLVERSFSGVGFHVWVFFDQPVEGYAARTLMLNALIEAKIPIYGKFEKGNDIGKSLDRLFPTQDHTKGYGNLIGLPLQGKAMLNGNCVFVDGDEKPYPDQWAKLEEAYANRVPVDHPKLKEKRHLTAPPVQRIETVSRADEVRWLELGRLEGQLKRMQDCEAIKASLNDPNQFSNTVWTSILTNIAVFGEAGRELAHTVSRNYDRSLLDSASQNVYSEQDTERAFYNKLNYLQQSGEPPSCRFLEENGWSCPKREAKTCALNFIALYGAPPSYSYYSSRISLTAEDREQLYRWEQNGGYKSYLEHFSDSTDFGVYKGEAIRGVKAKEYWILKHLLGDTRLYAKYPTWNKQVRSFWFEWPTENDADLFEEQILKMAIPFERKDGAFWLLKMGQEFNSEVGKELIRKIAIEAGITLGQHWDDPLVLREPYRVAPYFGKWKEYCY